LTHFERFLIHLFRAVCFTAVASCPAGVGNATSCCASSSYLPHQNDSEPHNSRETRWRLASSQLTGSWAWGDEAAGPTSGCAVAPPELWIAPADSSNGKTAGAISQNPVSRQRSAQRKTQCLLCEGVTIRDLVNSVNTTARCVILMALLCDALAIHHPRTEEENRPRARCRRLASAIRPSIILYSQSSN